MRNHKDILDIAIEAWLNEPVPAGPSPEFAEATLARIAALSGRGRGYTLWDVIWERFYRNRRMLELAAAAAIVILAGVLLLTRTPEEAIAYAKAIEAIKKVDNIITKSYEPGISEPYQTIWTSRSAKTLMFKTGQEYVLYDLDNKVRKSRAGLSGTIQTEQLTEGLYAVANTSILNRVDLMPFPNLSLAPRGMTWTVSEPAEDKAQILGTKVYELEWTNDMPYYGLRRLRIFLDETSKLPIKVECYRKGPENEAFRFETYTIIMYPQDSEIESQIRSIFE